MRLGGVLTMVARQQPHALLSVTACGVEIQRVTGARFLGFRAKAVQARARWR